jgi:hypothetical protein
MNLELVELYQIGHKQPVVWYVCVQVPCRAVPAYYVYSAFKFQLHHICSYPVQVWTWLSWKLEPLRTLDCKIPGK